MWSAGVDVGRKMEDGQGGCGAWPVSCCVRWCLSGGKLPHAPEAEAFDSCCGSGCEASRTVLPQSWGACRGEERRQGDSQEGRLIKQVGGQVAWILRGGSLTECRMGEHLAARLGKVCFECRSALTLQDRPKLD